MNSVQSQDDVVMLQLIDQDSNWVQLVVLIVHGGQYVSRDREGGLGLVVVLTGARRKVQPGGTMLKVIAESVCCP